jgi:tripartite-type tricarboxylate transporter receptor subunit TctC
MGPRPGGADFSHLFFDRGPTMTIPRRDFLRLAAGAATLPALSRVATADDYPTKPVRVLVGYAPGGTTDTLARMIGQRLADRLGQQFLIETRTGAGTNIATEALVRSPPDGYTLFLATSANAINATLYERLSFNFIRDVAPVAIIADAPLVMEVHPSVPVRTVPEFIAYARANPGKINMASAGTGSPVHVAGELFMMLTGTKLVHVPYRGSAPAITDMLGGQMQVIFDTVPTSLEHIRAGKLRPLAVTTANRLDALPDIPTVADFLPGFEASAWQGLCAPKGTPADIVNRLNKEVNAAVTDPKMKGQLEDLSLRVLAGTPADFGRLIADDTEKWAKVVKFAGIKAD